MDESLTCNSSVWIVHQSEHFVFYFSLPVSCSQESSSNKEAGFAETNNLGFVSTMNFLKAVLFFVFQCQGKDPEMSFQTFSSAWFQRLMHRMEEAAFQKPLGVNVGKQLYHQKHHQNFRKGLIHAGLMNYSHQRCCQILILVAVIYVHVQKVVFSQVRDWHVAFCVIPHLSKRAFGCSKAMKNCKWPHLTPLNGARRLY